MEIRRGILFVLSSPSGAGKSTLAQRLLRCDKDLALSISATTRAPRPKEQEGNDYYFITPQEFQKRIDQKQMLEYAKVFDHYYGTPKKPVLEALEAGRDILFDVDWQGTQQLRQTMRDDLVSVFILPPSLKILHERLSSRAQDSAEVVANRMAKAGGEISHWAEYDYVLINDDIEVTEHQLLTILKAERLKRHRQSSLPIFVQSLL